MLRRSEVNGRQFRREWIRGGRHLDEAAEVELACDDEPIDALGGRERYVVEKALDATSTYGRANAKGPQPSISRHSPP